MYGSGESTSSARVVTLPALFWVNFDGGECRRVLRLEVEAAADTGGAAGRWVGSGAFPEPAGKVRGSVLDGYPCLAIAGRGGQHHEGMGGNAAGLFRVQVVKLHQFGAVRNTRAYNHVMLMGRGFPEYRADGAAETRLWCGSAVTSVHFDMGRKTKPPRNIEEAISSISSFN